MVVLAPSRGSLKKFLADHAGNLGKEKGGEKKGKGKKRGRKEEIKDIYWLPKFALFTIYYTFHHTFLVEGWKLLLN